jgi:phage head maturation protease
MTGFFPYRRTKYRNDAPILAPFRYDDQQRPVGTAPTTYDATRHEVDCIVATQSPVRETFGVVVLTIRRDAVDLDLLHHGRLPLLHSHDPDRVLGSVIDAWLHTGQLYATLRFDKTAIGREAEAAVALGKLRNVSCKASVDAERWTAKDEAGEIKILNPDITAWGGDSSNRVFIAQRWRLTEISLTTCPVDMACVIL